MSLYDKIKKDTESALRASDPLRTSVLRMLAAQLHNKEIELRSAGKEAVLDDDDILDVVVRETKKRKEAIELYEKGKRADLREREEQELSILSSYLPAPLTDAEIETIIIDAIAHSGASTEKDFGKVMGNVSKQVKGRADVKKISELVRAKLGVHGEGK